MFVNKSVEIVSVTKREKASNHFTLLIKKKKIKHSGKISQRNYKTAPYSMKQLEKQKNYRTRKMFFL